MSTRQAIQLMTATLIFAIIFSLAISAEEANKTLQPTFHEVALPNDLESYLAEKLPEYRSVTQKDYDPDRFDGNTGLCWSVTGNFDGNGIADYALLMVGSVEGKRQVSLIAARAGEGGWSHDVLRSYAWEREVSDRIGLEPAGRVFMGYKEDGQERIESLSNPSVVMGGLEQCSAYRYYWKDGKWRDAYIRL